MHPQVKDFLHKYVNEFKQLGIKIDALILFGSQARGTATISSDIDIAVVMNEPLNPEERGCLLSLGDEIDMSLATNLFFTTSDAINNAVRDLDTNNSIRKEGVVLWEA